MRKIIIDTETAGLDPKSGVVEIAIIEVDDNFNTIATHHSLIDPEGPISPSASGVHGIVIADVMDSPTLRQFFDTDATRDFCQDSMLVIGHNVSFDLRFLAGELQGANIPVCTLRLARVLYPDAENHKLQTLRHIFGLAAGDAHSALGDTILCLNLVKQIAADLDGADVQALAAMCDRPVPVHKMAFGKHKGSALKDLPSGYKTWLLNQDIDKDLRYALESV